MAAGAELGIAGAALSYALCTVVETASLGVISARLISLPFASLAQNGVWRSAGFLLGPGMVLWMTPFISALLLQIGCVTLTILAFIVVRWHYVLDEVDKRAILSNIGKGHFLQKLCDRHNYVERGIPLRWVYKIECQYEHRGAENCKEIDL